MNKKTYQNLDKIDIKSVNDRLNEFSKYINDVVLYSDFIYIHYALPHLISNTVSLE